MTIIKSLALIFQSTLIFFAVQDLNLLIGEQEFALTKSLKPDTDKTKTVIVGIQNFEPGTPVQVKNDDVKNFL